MATDGNLWTRFRILPWWGQTAFWILLAPVPLLLWGFAGRSLRRGIAIAATLLWVVAAIAGSGSDTSRAATGDAPESSAPGSVTPDRQSPHSGGDSATSTSQRIPRTTLAPEDSTSPSTSPTSASPGPLTGGPDSASPLSKLSIASEGAIGPYSRDSFPHWRDEDSNGCDTRCEVLATEKLPSGGWMSVYDGLMVYDASDLDIDHMVPLAEAWRSGASRWTEARRTAFANDLKNPSTLLAVTASSNRSKQDRDPSRWRPQVSEWCSYAHAWISVKVEWSLSADPAEEQSLVEMLRTCPSS